MLLKILLLQNIAAYQKYNFEFQSKEVIDQLNLLEIFKEYEIQEKLINISSYNGVNNYNYLLMVRSKDQVINAIDKIKLSPIQKNIYNKINLIFLQNQRPQFLYGIPGSGKTEIYLKLTKNFFSQKKSCLILVPEIVLSSQIFYRFQQYFGNKVLLWHSQASEGYKNQVLYKLRQKSPYIIVGARSALFTPLTNLGLIIVDEEHDSSYKESERQPCYNARDLAIIRGQNSNSMVLLGSATPSLETYYNSTITNKYLDLKEIKCLEI